VSHVSTCVHASFTEGAGSVHLACLASCHVTQTARHRRPGTLQLKGPELKLSTTTRAAAVSSALAATLALAACGASNESSTAGSAGSGSAASSSAPELNGTLNGSGSSAQGAAMQGWTAGFSAVQSGVTVNYETPGSGAGRKAFLAGGVDFAGSDSALNADESTAATTLCGPAGFFELPNYISAIAVIYNLEGVKDLQLSPATLAKIFAGSITTWNDPAIAADNPGATLPSTAITTVHRSDDSGTTTNFTDYLKKTAADVWTFDVKGTWQAPGGEGADQTRGMVSAVQAGAGSIGYADESQAGDLGVAKIKVGTEYVAPSPEGAAAVVANSPAQEGRGQYDGAISVNRATTSADEYPLVLVSYHIGCLEPKDAAKGALLKGFLNYVISEDGQQAAAKQAGSAPIADAQREKSQKAVDAIKG
jgi:phosphate transport system substrate-binding protein